MILIVKFLNSSNKSPYNKPGISNCLVQNHPVSKIAIFWSFHFTYIQNYASFASFCCFPLYSALLSQHTHPTALRGMLSQVVLHCANSASILPLYHTRAQSEYVGELWSISDILIQFVLE